MRKTQQRWIRGSVTLVVATVVSAGFAAAPLVAAEPVMPVIEADKIWEGAYEKGRVIGFPTGKDADPRLAALLEAIKAKQAEQAAEQEASESADSQPAATQAEAAPSENNVPALPKGPEAFLDVTYDPTDGSGNSIFVVVQRFPDTAALEAFWQASASDDWTVGEEDGNPVFTYISGEVEESGYRNKTGHFGRYLLVAKQLHAGEDYLAAFDAYREHVKTLE